MSQEELTLIFAAFAQTETGRKAKEGTGLGLHISQAMVRLMGGEIEVESAAGQGTRFRFALPLKEGVAVESPHLQEGMVIGLAEGQRSLKVLVVDDRADNRDLLRELLTGWGFEVQEAVDGRAGLEAWEAWKPDLVWMDLRMPRMNGPEAASRIRARETELGLSRTPLFALSASVLESDRASVLASGFDEFIFKPFQEEQIAQVMEKHAGLRFRRAEAAKALDAGLAPEALAGLDPAWKDRFRKALLMGDSDEAMGLLPGLGNDTLAGHLAALVEAYRFEELLRLFEESGAS